MKDYLKKEIEEKIKRSYENIKIVYSLISNDNSNLSRLEWNVILSTYKNLIEIKNILGLYNKEHEHILNQSEKEYEKYINYFEEIILSCLEKN